MSSYQNIDQKRHMVVGGKGANLGYFPRLYRRCRTVKRMKLRNHVVARIGGENAGTGPNTEIIMLRYRLFSSNKLATQVKWIIIPKEESI
jgi:hypothetical protein